MEIQREDRRYGVKLDVFNRNKIGSKPKSGKQVHFELLAYTVS